MAVALILGLAAFWLFAASARAINDEVVIVLERGHDRADARQLARGVGGRIVAAIPQLNAFLVHLGSGADERRIAGALDRERGVLSASAESALTVSAVDPLLASAWHMTTIKASEAWAVTTGTAGVQIAIVDTGVDYTHPDLVGKVVAGPDYGSGDSDPRDTHGHGTHVAGIAAASRDNGTGSAGVCPACTLVAVKGFPDGASSASSFAVAQGITWAADNGVEVINLSLGSATPSSLTQSAVDYAWSRGAVVVAAAGNSSTSAAHYPAAFTNAIAVGATTASDTLASFSNYGSWVDMTAPGAGVLSTVPGSGYQAWSGTSMASPVVAGAAGLAFSGLPGATNATVRGALEAAVVDLGAPGRDTVYGTGRLDLSRLFGTPPGPNPNPPPPTAPPPSVTTTNLPTGTVGTAYATTLAASGGTAPLTWSLSSGALPAGLSLASTTGAISGTPSAAGGFSFTVRVADAGGRTATRVLYLSITAPPPPSILTSTLPAGVVGTTYTATLTAAGGKAPYTWSLAYGTLPAGLTLHPTTGAIGGTPTTAGTASLTVRVTDANNRTALRSYYLSIAPRPA